MQIKAVVRPQFPCGFQLEAIRADGVCDRAKNGPGYREVFLCGYLCGKARNTTVYIDRLALNPRFIAGRYFSIEATRRSPSEDTSALLRPYTLPSIRTEASGSPASRVSGFSP